MEGVEGYSPRLRRPLITLLSLYFSFFSDRWSVKGSRYIVSYDVVLLLLVLAAV